MKLSKVCGLVALALVLGMLVQACGPAAAPTQAPAQQPTQASAAEKPALQGHGKDGKYKVVLVNSFLGNDYRIQMQRAAEAASKYQPYSDVIDFSILNTDNTPEAQRQGLENLIAGGVDAILLDAVDNKSVNDVVQKACDKGVKVITFDITARPGACEYAIEFDFYNWAVDAGKWLAKAAGADKHPINVIMDKGLQGVDIAQRIYQGGLDGLYAVAPKENINIVGEYFGEFAEGPQEPLISAILAANPDKKIDVVFTQGYCTTVASAFKNAGLDYAPLMYCQGYNSNLLLLLQPGMKGFVNLTTNAGSIGALDTAYRLFTGENPPKEQPWAVRYVVSDTSVDIGKPTEMVEAGKNAFPDLPLGFQPYFNWGSAKVQITVEEAAGLKK